MKISMKMKLKNWQIGKQKNLSTCFTNLSEFYDSRIKNDEASVDVYSDFEDGVISDILRKIVVRIRSLINLDNGEKNETEKDKELSLSDKKINFLKEIHNFFHSFFNSAKKTAVQQWQGLEEV